MFRWLRPRPSRPDTALAMVDPRARDAVLFLGAETPALAGESGAITRLNGRTVVLATRREDSARIERAAEQAGGLVEVIEHFSSPQAPVAIAEATFQIVVAPDISLWPTETWRPRFADASRALAPGGRLIAMVGAERTGALGRFSKPAISVAADPVIDALKAAGLVAARKLASANGVDYFEARKPR